VTLGPDDALLTGRVAVVTGAGQGIGAACATALARFGCDVAICDRVPAGLPAIAGEIEAAGRGCDSIELDVRDAAATTAWIDRVAERFGHVDVLVNNAGGTFRAPYESLSPNAEAALLSQNFGQVSSTTRAVLPHVPEAGGSIVNVTSIEAHRAAPGFAVYAAAKAAVANLTLSLALELSPRGIRVNCVAPDVIMTPGIGFLSDVEPDPDAWPRWGTADDVAGAVVWLAGDLSRFVTGTTVHVDGGTMAASGWRRVQADGTWIL
jgi:NAD(P)-dependent dehydrogenase (short-subunit alcohol dehydrogenase family)